METSTCMVNEPLIDEPSSVEICRLKSGLNASCLLEVFDYLDIDDLIRVCKVDKYFEELIIKWTIKKKKIAIDDEFSKQIFDRLSSDDAKIMQIFRKFGKSIRKLQLCGHNNFSMWLEVIMEYCKPARIIEFDLEVYCFYGEVNPNVMQVIQESMPFFANLQKLILRQKWRFQIDESYIEFLTYISTTATNLQKLELRGTPLKLGWLKNMQNLYELLIILDCNLVYDLDNCWGSNPKLKVFKFVGHQNITAVGDELSKYFTGLTEFSDISLENPYNYFGAAMIERYKFLSSFLHLNCVTLTSYTFCGCDLYYPLMTLATKNIITLKVYMNYKQPIVLTEKEKDEIMRRPLPHFFNLQTVEIKLSKDICTLGDDRMADCDLRCQFMFRFVSQLKNLQCVKFCGNFLVNLNKILEHVPELPILHISACVEVYEIQNIGKTLRKVRKSNDGDLFNLILNDCYLESIYTEYTEEFHKLKDIMKISFKGPTLYAVLHTPRKLTHMKVL